MDVNATLESNSSLPYFYLVHITSVICLGISIPVCVVAMVFVYVDGDSRNIFQRRRGERIVFYIALTDLLYSVGHLFDHCHSLITLEVPGGVACVVSAFCLQEFFTAQSLIVLIAAFSACLQTRHDYRIGYGKYDVGLHFMAFGIPAVIGAVLCSFDLLGPGDYWCLANLSNPKGFIVNYIFTGITILVFVLSLTFYILIGLKVKATTQALHTHHSDVTRRTRRRTACLSAAIVAAYVAQSWPYVVAALWSRFAPPPIALLECEVICSNLGAVFNVFAYTVIRRDVHHGRRSSTSSVDASERRPSSDAEIAWSDYAKLGPRRPSEDSIMVNDVQVNVKIEGIHM